MEAVEAAAGWVGVWRGRFGRAAPPMVPIALVSGQSGSLFIASNHAACSHLELGLAPCGGGS